MKKTRKSTRRSTPTSRSPATNDAVVILERLIENDPTTRRLADQATVNAMVAKLIFEARQKAGLTQRQLAELAGTRQPVIARLEDSAYSGHSLTMLHRIASALNRSLVIRFSQDRQSQTTASRRAA